MGMGNAAGENRAVCAIENALASPLLNSNDITGAKSILINISSGTGEHELTMDELGDITDYMYATASDDALIIRGLSSEAALGENISITVIATGFEANSLIEPAKPRRAKTVEMLNGTDYVPPPHLIPDKTEENFNVHQKGQPSIISDAEDEYQGVLDP